jgi:hypothetical protein
VADNFGVTLLFAVLIVFLVLAAQFESFVHPAIIMTTVPLALLGAVFGLKLHGMSINIYSQIAVIMLIGIAAKNGVLIVEFANQLRDRGVEFREAIVKAAATWSAAGVDDEFVHRVRRDPVSACNRRRRRATQTHRYRGFLWHAVVGVSHAAGGAGRLFFGGAPVREA